VPNSSCDTSQARRIHLKTCRTTAVRSSTSEKVAVTKSPLMESIPVDISLTKFTPNLSVKFDQRNSLTMNMSSARISICKLSIN